MNIATRRNMIVAALVAIAVVIALGLGIAARPDLANMVGDTVSQGVKSGVQGIKTVAAMMAERSPGERAKGALASLKHKRAPALHERALPKVRRPSPPINPLTALLIPPPSPPVAPVAPVPLYDLVAGPPVIVPPVTGTTGGGGGGTIGGPPSFTEIPPPGGGGGGVFVPPTTTTTQQVPPPTSAVPEPGTWAMMLLGFGFMGLTLRRDRRRLALATSD